MTYPDKPATIAMLEAWQDQHTAVCALLDGIEASPIGLDPNGLLFNTVWNLSDHYTFALTKLVGDNGKWLEWFQAENEMGARGREAGYDGALKPVETLDDLYELIAESRKRAEA